VRIAPFIGRFTALFLAAAVLATSAVATPFAVQVGESRVALDAPPGFSDVQMTGSPRLLELAEALTSASNRILLFALEDADVRRFNVGDNPVLRRYVIAVTPKGLENTRVNQASFQRMAAESLRELGSAPPAGMAYRAYLDGQPRGRPTLLAELRRDEDTICVLQGMRLPDPQQQQRAREPQYMLSTTTIMLVRGKALNVALYTAYASDADVDWIRATTARWVEEIQRLNLR
jgi:hypothetical protein